jgi:hypothetical protein
MTLSQQWTQKLSGDGCYETQGGNSKSQIQVAQVAAIAAGNDIFIGAQDQNAQRWYRAIIHKFSADSERNEEPAPTIQMSSRHAYNELLRHGVDKNPIVKRILSDDQVEDSPLG